MQEEKAGIPTEDRDVADSADSLRRWETRQKEPVERQVVHTYQVVVEHVSWEEAKYRAEQMGGHSMMQVTT